MNQYYNQYPQQVPYTQYNNNMPVPKATQPLTPEQIKQLRSRAPEFTMNVDPIDIMKAVCTHKENGQLALDQVGDNMVCRICGAMFNPDALEVDDVQMAVSKIIDILQLIKTYYIDISEDMARQYFPIMPLIAKIPKLYEMALANFNRYDQNPLNQVNSNNYGFGLLGTIMNPAGMGMMMGGGMPGMMGGYMGQQMPNQGYTPQQPMMGQQMPVQGYAPQQPMNGQFYGNPIGYQPQQPAPIQQEVPAQQNVAPVAQPQEQQVVNTKVFGV